MICCGKFDFTGVEKGAGRKIATYKFCIFKAALFRMFE